MVNMGVCWDMSCRKKCHLRRLRSNICENLILGNQCRPHVTGENDESWPKSSKLFKLAQSCARLSCNFLQFCLQVSATLGATLGNVSQCCVNSRNFQQVWATLWNFDVFGQLTTFSPVTWGLMVTLRPLPEREIGLKSGINFFLLISNLHRPVFLWAESESRAHLRIAATMRQKSPSLCVCIGDSNIKSAFSPHENWREKINFNFDHRNHLRRYDF